MQDLIYKNLYLLYLKTLSYGIAQILYVLLSIVLLTYLLFSLSTTEFGTYSLARVAPMLLIPLISINLNTSLIRFYQEWRKSKIVGSSIYTVLITQFIWLFISLPIIFLFAETIYGFLFTKIDYFPLIFLFWNLFFAVISLFLLFRNIKKKFNQKIALEVLRFSLPTVPETSINYVMMSIDRIFIDKFFDLKTIGVYSFARSLIQILNPIARTFKTSFIPYYYKIINEKLFKIEVIKSFYLFNLIILLFISIISLYIENLLFIFENKDYQGSSSLIFLLGIYLYLDSIILVNYFLIQSTSKTEYLLIGYIVKLTSFLFPIFSILWLNWSITIYSFTLIYIFSNTLYLVYLETTKSIIRNLDYKLFFNITYSLLIFSLISVSISLSFEFEWIYKLFIIFFQIILLYTAMTPMFKR
jgi:O-antigen/teichoic acid export membrane protein